MYASFDSAIPLLSVYPTNILIHVLKNISRIFMTLFIMTRQEIICGWQTLLLTHQYPFHFPCNSRIPKLVKYIANLPNTLAGKNGHVLNFWTKGQQQSFWVVCKRSSMHSPSHSCCLEYSWRKLEQPFVLRHGSPVIKDQRAPYQLPWTSKLYHKRGIHFYFVSTTMFGGLFVQVLILYSNTHPKCPPVKHWINKLCYICILYGY